MKLIKSILLILWFSFFIWISSAQRYCDPNRLELKWESSITTNQVAEYTTNDTWWLENSNEFNTSYTLWKNGQKLESVQGDKFFFNFENEWEYLLKANLNLDGCKYNLEKKLDVFYKSVFYIWYDLEEFGIWYENNFKSKHLCFFNLPIELFREGFEQAIWVYSGDSSLVVDNIMLSFGCYNNKLKKKKQSDLGQNYFDKDAVYITWNYQKHKFVVLENLWVVWKRNTQAGLPIQRFRDELDRRFQPRHDQGSGEYWGPIA